mmetsp:Transcript_44066/g.86164  ORF Transcript_44066/g.86164 Transcript_44066/m.86164 type:complete len:213 (-) Transcript_44066:200-838(-)
MSPLFKCLCVPPSTLKSVPLVAGNDPIKWVALGKESRGDDDATRSAVAAPVLRVEDDVKRNPPCRREHQRQTHVRERRAQLPHDEHRPVPCVRWQLQAYEHGDGDRQQPQAGEDRVGDVPLLFPLFSLCVVGAPHLQFHPHKHTQLSSQGQVARVRLVLVLCAGSVSVPASCVGDEEDDQQHEHHHIRPPPADVVSADRVAVCQVAQLAQQR